jgi:copper(I)-binding protein
VKEKESAPGKGGGGGGDHVLLVGIIARLWAGDVAACTLEFDDVVMVEADVQINLLPAKQNSGNQFSGDGH